MENISKALIIAGGTLVGVMIVSIFIYLFRAGGNVSQRMDDRQIYNNIQYFNSQFEDFAGTEESLNTETGLNEVHPKGNTISDVISCINLAADANKDVGYNALNAVSVDLKLDDSHIYSVVGIIPLDRNYVLVGKSDDLDTAYRANNNMTLNKINILELRNKPVKDMHLSSSYTGPNVKDAETFSEAVRDPHTNKIVYKYLFKVPEDGIEYYHAATRSSNNKSYDGRVNKITLELFHNPDYDRAVDAIEAARPRYYK